MDLGLATHTSLNITGSAGAGGATWLTVVDQAPENPAGDNIYGSEFLCADILIQRFDNTKGAGVVAFLNEGVGQKGLALILYNAGNTDRLVLATVEGDPAQAGKLATVREPAVARRAHPGKRLVPSNADGGGRRTAADHGPGLQARGAD